MFHFAGFFKNLAKIQYWIIFSDIRIIILKATYG